MDNTACPATSNLLNYIASVRGLCIGCYIVTDGTQLPFLRYGVVPDSFCVPLNV